jgi:hypothetical protein
LNDRLLLRERTIQVVQSTRPRTRHIVLFSDAVLLLKKLKRTKPKKARRYQYDALIPLRYALVRQNSSSMLLLRGVSIIARSIDARLNLSLTHTRTLSLARSLVRACTIELYENALELVRNDEQKVLVLIFDGEVAVEEWRQVLEQQIGELVAQDRIAHVHDREVAAAEAAADPKPRRRAPSDPAVTEAPAIAVGDAAAAAVNVTEEPTATRAKLSKSKSLSRVFSKNRFSSRKGV